MFLFSFRFQKSHPNWQYSETIIQKKTISNKLKIINLILFFVNNLDTQYRDSNINQPLDGCIDIKFLTKSWWVGWDLLWSTRKGFKFNKEKKRVANQVLGFERLERGVKELIFSNRGFRDLSLRSDKWWKFWEIDELKN